MYDVEKLVGLRARTPTVYAGVELLPGDDLIYDTESEKVIRLSLAVRPSASKCGSQQQPTCSEAKKEADKEATLT